jgi:hypothetical protein
MIEGRAERLRQVIDASAIECKAKLVDRRQDFRDDRVELPVRQHCRVNGRHIIRAVADHGMRRRGSIDDVRPRWNAALIRWRKDRRLGKRPIDFETGEI